MIWDTWDTWDSWDSWDTWDTLKNGFKFQCLQHLACTGAVWGWEELGRSRKYSERFAYRVEKSFNDDHKNVHLAARFAT